MNFEMMKGPDDLYIYGHLTDEEIEWYISHGYKRLEKSKPAQHERKKKKKEKKKLQPINWSLLNNYN